MRNKQVKAGSVRSNDKSAEAKLQSVIATASMIEQERGAYCREHGIYTHHLGEWREQFLQGFGASTISRKEAKEERKLQNEYNKLKRELHKKDKALAEVSALLMILKKNYMLHIYPKLPCYLPWTIYAIANASLSSCHVNDLNKNMCNTYLRITMNWISGAYGTTG